MEGNGAVCDPQVQAIRAPGELAPLALAYLHLIEGQTGGARPQALRLRRAAPPPTATPVARLPGWSTTATTWRWPSSRWPREPTWSPSAKAFIANPDLTGRLRRGGPFNEPDRATFYGGTGQGYTDYPALA